MSMMRRRLLDNTVRKTAEGESVAVRSVARMEPGLSLYGKSHQNTVAGNQLLDVVNVAGVTSNGVTITNNGDGSFTVTGTPTNTEGNVFTYWLVRELVLEDGQHALSSGISCFINKKDDTVQYVGSSFAFDSETDESINIYWQRGITNYVDGETVWPMLNTGFTALPWEPYTGSQPSPNPDYPQEIVSVGDDGEIGVDVYGGNFVLNPEEVVHFEGNIGDGVNSIGLSKFIAIATEEQLLKNDISFSFDSDGGGESNFSLLIRTKYGTEYKFSQSSIYFKIINGWNIVEVSKSAFTNLIVTGVDRIEVQIRPSKPLIDDVNFNITNLTLNIGSTALPFEPYKQPQSLIVSTPNGLPGIPVFSGGNYTDENGQQWISDEVDFKRGKYVKRVKERIYGENENVRASGYDAVYTIKQEDVDHSTPMLSNMFIYKVGVVDGNDFVSLSDFSDSVIFGLSWITGKDAEAAKNWFAQKYAEGNPVKVLYVLATPIETDLPPEQITAYQSLHTNYPTTTVMNDEGAGIKLTYKTRKSLEVTT